MEWINLIVTFVMGGGLVALFTIKWARQKVKAEAKGLEAAAESTEIDNAEKVARMWREYAEAAEMRYKLSLENTTAELVKMQERMSEMECTIKKLTSTNNQILKILKDINHDNLEQKKQEAKDIAGA